MRNFPGDKGKTFLLYNKSCSKAELVFDVLGDLDELNCFLGVVKAGIKKNDYKKLIEGVQKDIFKISGYLAGASKISSALIESLDKNIEWSQKKIGLINKFVISGKSLVGANLDVCRAISRRAERGVIRLSKEKKLDINVLVYLNHLSKFLFFFARMVERR